MCAGAVSEILEDGQARNVKMGGRRHGGPGARGQEGTKGWRHGGGHGFLRKEVLTTKDRRARRRGEIGRSWRSLRPVRGECSQRNRRPPRRTALARPRALPWPARHIRTRNGSDGLLLPLPRREGAGGGFSTGARTPSRLWPESPPPLLPRAAPAAFKG
jgi:hypothetical protein